MLTHYVYILSNPITHIPFYVGMGQGNRMYQHILTARSKTRNTNTYTHHQPLYLHLRALDAVGQLPVYTKVLEGVTYTQALNKERELIHTIGRLLTKTGPLTNLSRGGQRGGESCKPVKQYTLNGQLVSTYPSAKAASEQVDAANQSYITQCCKGKRVSAGGYLWSYEYATPPAYTKKYYKPVDQFTVDGIKIASFISLTAACDATGLSVSTIGDCCRGRLKTSGGFVWRYQH